MKKRKYKWFIEDAETGEWLRNTLHLEPTSHIFCKWSDNPPLLSQNYWTKNPLEAFCCFKNKADCEKFINDALSKNPIRIEFLKTGHYDIPRVLLATEHEFVN